jgi:hypothetical protein
MMLPNVSTQPGKKGCHSPHPLAEGGRSESPAVPPPSQWERRAASSPIEGLLRAQNTSSYVPGSTTYTVSYIRMRIRRGTTRTRGGFYTRRSSIGRIGRGQTQRPTNLKMCPNTSPYFRNGSPSRRRDVSRTRVPRLRVARSRRDIPLQKYVHLGKWYRRLTKEADSISWSCLRNGPCSPVNKLETCPSGAAYQPSDHDRLALTGKSCQYLTTKGSFLP